MFIFMKLQVSELKFKLNDSRQIKWVVNYVELTLIGVVSI